MIPFPSHLFPSLPYNPFIQLSDRIVGQFDRNAAVYFASFVRLPPLVPRRIEFSRVIKGIGDNWFATEFDRIRIFLLFGLALLSTRDVPMDQRERERERFFISSL